MLLPLSTLLVFLVYLCFTIHSFVHESIHSLTQQVILDLSCARLYVVIKEDI